MPTTIANSTLEKFTTFGDLLRFLRRRSGITQMELALAVGYSDAQISRLEQNLRMPDITTVQARFIPALDLEDEPQAAARLMDLAAHVRREDAPVFGLCPYKGLNYFDETDADLFVGREGLTARLVERVLDLTGGQTPSETRFLAIVGSSGSGKSSLVRAGVVPALHWEKVSADWEVHILTPTAHPLESLVLSLSEETSSFAASAALMDDLARDPRSLHLYAKRQVNVEQCSHLLLVIDQFEELFTLCRAEAEQIAFIDNLLTAASEIDGPIIVLITLRADFYAHCAAYPALRTALASQQEYIGAMRDDELRRAIEEPARRGRWELEPGLVELLLHDVGHEPGALPLLSHALLETWHRRRGRVLTLSGYAASGGVRGAIAETAEAVFADQFNPEQKAIARRIFLRLTELGDETATGDTRRRANYTELILNPAQREITESVLKVLADARLIITSADSVEVAHEALIREWPTLCGWLEDNREDLRLHRQLTEAAQEWASRGYTADVLYRGIRLAQACEWAGRHEMELNIQEREYLVASQALADCETVEKETQRQRELEAAHKLAEAERRRAEEQAHSTVQLRKRSIYLAVAFMIAIGMALIAGFMSWQARTASRMATSRELAAAAFNNLEIDPERSVLLGMEAISSAYTLEAENVLHQAVLASRVRLSIPAHEPGVPISVVFSPDGRRLATASPDEGVKIWDSTSGELIFSTTGHYASFSPDGRVLATVIFDGTVKLWDAATGEEIDHSGSIDATIGVVFSPDGSRLATVTSGNLPRIWDLKTGEELLNFPGHTEYVSSAFFSPDGTRLLTASDDGTARVWDTTSGEQLFNLPSHLGWVWSAVYSPDGSRIASASGNEAVIWDAKRGEKLLTLSGHKNTVNAVAFSPDSTRLATGSEDRLVKIWDATTGKELYTLPGHNGAVYTLAFSPDGARLASGSDDGSVRIWDLTANREWFSTRNPQGVSTQVVFSPDGKTMARVEKNIVRIWDPSSGQDLLTLSAYNNLVSALCFSPDGKYLVTAGDTAKVILWDITSGAQLTSWSAHTGRLNALAISPDGKLLATGSDDYKVKIWELSALEKNNPSPPQVVLTFDLVSEIKSVAFSPDGNRLAAGVYSGTVKIWDMASHAELLSLRGHSEAIMSIAFSLDEERVATASLDGTARVWNARTGNELLTLSGHTGAVMGVAFSPVENRLATASRDGAVKIWDGDRGQELLTFFGDGEGLNCLAYSPDGTRLATSSDTGIQVYLLKIEDLVALARQRVTRGLTGEECQKFLHKEPAACAEPAPVSNATPWPPAANGRICQVTNSGGLNDDYFNELIYKGLQESANLFSWEATTLQSVSLSDYEKNLRAFTGADCRLIFTAGTFVEAIQSAAEANPDQKYFLPDFALSPPLENVWNQAYAVDQAAFLAGYLAASLTKTGKLGVFGGVDIPQVTDFMDGFALGVEYYNAKKGTSVSVIGWDPVQHTGWFTGGFCCTTEGRQMAQRLLDQGVDFVLPVAGKSVGWGAGAAVKEWGDAWLIGVDTDWAITAPEFADIVLTSIEKRFDVSVTQVAGSLIKDEFKGGIHLGTLASGEVGISPFYNLEGLISDPVKAELEQVKADIIAGKIKTRP